MFDKFVKEIFEKHGVKIVNPDEQVTTPHCEATKECEAAQECCEVKQDCIPAPKEMKLLGGAFKLEFDTWYQLPEVEEERIYHYVDGKIRVEGVKAICVSKSGNHRLLTFDDHLIFVVPGWLMLDCYPAITY